MIIKDSRLTLELKQVGSEISFTMSDADQNGHINATLTFREAQRVDPDNPSHAALELTLLVSRGEIEQARERARFWLARLERLRDPALADMIGYPVSTLTYTSCPNPGFVSHWSFNDCGSIVGRVELHS